MTPKTFQFCDEPKTNIDISYLKIIFLKTPKNIAIQNFEPKKKVGKTTDVWK